MSTAPSLADSKARVLACLDQTGAAETVVRRAARLARLLRAPWEAVHVATPIGQRASRQAQERLLCAFRLSEELGGESRTLNGASAAAEILAYAKASGVTHIVVGAPSRPLLLELLFGSFVRTLARGAGEMSIEICPRAQKRAGELAAEAARLPPLGDVGAYGVATGVVAAATLLALPMERSIGLPNVSLVYVLAVILAATRYGAAAATYTAILSSLAYNFFLTRPYYTFAIADPRNVWAVFFFLLVGVIVSGVAAHARAQTMIARKQAGQAAALQTFAHGLVGVEEAARIAQHTVEAISQLTYARAVLLTNAHGALEAIAETPGPEMLGADDLKAAQWAFEHRREAGHGSDTLDGARWLFVPIPGEHGFLGVIGVRPFDDALRLDPEQRRLLDLIADQAGLALDRVRFARAAADARVAAESSKGRLLSAVSGDLAGPLAAIRGAVENIKALGDRHEPARRQELLTLAANEAKRLSGSIENLLDLAQIEATNIQIERAPVNLADIVDAAIDRAHDELGARPVSRDVPASLAPLSLDRALTEAALANVLGNAAKYGPAHGRILVRGSRQDNSVVIEVLDEGPGFPAEAVPNLLDQFARAPGDDGASRAGLGLATAKRFIAAQGGAIEARNRTDRSGACVRIALPLVP